MRVRKTTMSPYKFTCRTIQLIKIICIATISPRDETITKDNKITQVTGKYEEFFSFRAVSIDTPRR